MKARLNQSFSRRIGKSLSGTQKGFLDQMLPKFLVDNSKIDGEVYLEIGFGMGEHFIHQARMNPQSYFIGSEPYLNGVANVLKAASLYGIDNFGLWPDDVDLLLENLPDHSLNGIYILFPDPWPKRKQNKKRILNNERLDIFKMKLKPGAFINFASDIYQYIEGVQKTIASRQDFKEVERDEFLPFVGYTETKYHKKALEKGIKPKFLSFEVLM